MSRLREHNRQLAEANEKLAASESQWEGEVVAAQGVVGLLRDELSELAEANKKLRASEEARKG